MSEIGTFTDPYEVRLACRENRIDFFPSLAVSGYLCVNLVTMDADYADDFAEFCRRNPRPCPLLGTTAPGQTDAPEFGRDIDLRTDLRSYDVYREGRKVATRQEVGDLFTDRSVSFLIGSSVSFDGLLEERGYPPGFGPCIYLTSMECEPVGRYHGRTAVTMRSYAPAAADAAAELTSHFPKCHGGPIGRNNPAELGIDDEEDHLLPPPQDHGVPTGHDKLYWACGVTPSIVAREAKLPLMMVHTPGNAMVTDVRTESLYE